MNQLWTAIRVLVLLYSPVKSLCALKQHDTVVMGVACDLLITLLSCFSEEFKEIITHTTLHQQIEFDCDSEFVKLYFGKDRKRLIPYHEFSQFIHVRHIGSLARCSRGSPFF